MKIVRDGIWHTLTPQELYDAYEEQEHIYDCEDIRFQLDEMIGDIECGETEEDEETKVIRAIASSEEMISDCAYRKRRMMDKYDVSWDYAVSEAIQEVVRERLL